MKYKRPAKLYATGLNDEEKRMWCECICMLTPAQRLMCEMVKTCPKLAVLRLDDLV